MSKNKGWHIRRRREQAHREATTPMQRRQSTMSILDLGPSGPFVLTDEHRTRMGVPIGGSPRERPPVRVSNPNGPVSWSPNAQVALARVEALFNSNSEVVEKAFRVLCLYIEQGIGKDINSFDIIIPHSTDPVTNLKVTWRKM